MAKNPVSSATETTVVAEPESTQKTKSAKPESTGSAVWDTFVKAGFGVKRIKTDVLPGAPADHSCKTTLLPKAQSIVDHIQAGHSDGFIVTIRENMKPWQGWYDLAAAGVEIRWIKDEVTDHVISNTVQSLQSAMRPHQGKHRGAYQAYHNQLMLNLFIPNNTPALSTGENLDEDDDYFE